MIHEASLNTDPYSQGQGQYAGIMLREQSSMHAIQQKRRNPMNANKQFILHAAAAQGLTVSALPISSITAFVGCVLLELMVRPLPEALTRCFEKITTGAVK
jgi:hypothetical protein